MASNSPGSEEEKGGIGQSEASILTNEKAEEENAVKRQKFSRAEARASLSDKVGFFEQVFGSQAANERPVFRSRDL